MNETNPTPAEMPATDHAAEAFARRKPEPGYTAASGPETYRDGLRVDAYHPRMAALDSIKRAIAERSAKELAELRAQIARVHAAARAESDAANAAAEAHASALSEALADELRPRYFELARQFPEAPRKTAAAFKALIREHHERARMLFGDDSVPTNVIAVAFAATIDRADYMGAMGVPVPQAVGTLVTAACKDEPGSAIESHLYDVEEAVHQAAKGQVTPDAERTATVLRHASWRRHHAALEAFDAGRKQRKREAEEAHRPVPARPVAAPPAGETTIDARGLAKAMQRALGGGA